MTDQRLHDLLHDTVSDLTAPDLAETAWRSGVRARRRRTAALAAGATAAVVAIAGAAAFVDRGPSAHGPTTGPSSPTTSTPTSGPTRTVRPYVPDPAPDARYAGVPVWWSPTLAQEERLPAYPDGPLPPVIDLRQPRSSLVLDPIRHAVAAFAVFSGPLVKGVDVLGADGLLRNVKIGPEPGGSAPVQPMRDPEGHLRIRAGASMLSRSGEYLMFPQEHSVAIMTLRTGTWRTIDTGTAPTWDATWISDREFALVDPARPLAQAPEYSVDGKYQGSSNVIASGLPDFPIGSSQLYGRARTGHEDIAQAFYPGAGIPQPPTLRLSPRQSDWIAINGTHDGILLIGQEPGRQKGCCQVDGWIGPDTVLYDSSSSTGTRLIAWQVGTGRFWQVSRLTGVTLERDDVVSSYAQFPAAGAPSPP